MRLSSYMRGLGIGMVVAALLMGLNRQSVPLTDREIKEKARRLGMVEKDAVVLSNALPKSFEESVSLDSALMTVSRPAMSEDETELASSAGVETVLSDREVSSGDDLLPGKDSSSGKDEGNSDSKDKESSSTAGKSDIKTSESDKDGSSAQNKEKAGSSAAGKNDSKTSESDKDSSSAKNKDKASSSAAGKSDSIASESDKDSSSAKNKDKASSSAAGKSDGKTSAKGKDSSSAAENKDKAGKYITIAPGDSSTTVAVKLKEAGVIKDAAAFDSYLCETGYDRRITTGKKMIPAGASEVEIAGIITVR